VTCLDSYDSCSLGPGPLKAVPVRHSPVTRSFLEALTMVATLTPTTTPPPPRCCRHSMVFLSSASLITQVGRRTTSAYSVRHTVTVSAAEVQQGTYFHWLQSLGVGPVLVLSSRAHSVQYIRNDGIQGVCAAFDVVHKRGWRCGSYAAHRYH